MSEIKDTNNSFYVIHDDVQNCIKGSNDEKLEGSTYLSTWEEEKFVKSWKVNNPTSPKICLYIKQWIKVFSRYIEHHHRGDKIFNNV